MAQVKNKAQEAAVLGVITWMAGALLLLLLRTTPYLAAWAVSAAFLTVPMMWLITRWHMRDVSAEQRAYTGLRLGVIFTATHCLLDGGGLWLVFNLNWPLLAAAAREALVLALVIGYFWMLTIPQWVRKQK